jgi:predicted transcriptional regulator YdeE
MIDKTDLLTLPSFFVAGISVRTINNGQAGKDIKALWDRFFGDNILSKIEHKASGDIYNVYADYESDYTGYYTAVLGCRVTTLEGLPEGLTGITVPASKYNVYSLSGKCPHNVLDAWAEIWKSGANRKYSADFDVYTPNYSNFEDSVVKIYVGIS